MTEADTERTRNARYGSGVAIAILTSFLIIWTTIVRDDGSGAALFMIILAACAGAFAVEGHAAGLARAMVGVAAMQTALGMLTATAPITATVPDGVLKAVIYNGIATILWLASAACFHSAANEPSGNS